MQDLAKARLSCLLNQKMKIRIFCFFILLSSSQVFANNQNIEPGNLISILVDENHIENNKYSYIYNKNQKYLIAAASFSMQGKVLNINNKKFTVGSKNFGESRIVIKDQSKVELSQEDSNRAYLESQEIKKALKIYSKENYPNLNFIVPVEGIISSRYGKKRFINNKPRSPHLALDIAAPNGTKVVSPSNGKIILIGDFFYSGKFIMIDHGYGIISTYSHLDNIDVSINEVVLSGYQIGSVGSTGRVTGPHLHWSVYVNSVRINPELLIQENFLFNLLDSS